MVERKKELQNIHMNNGHLRDLVNVLKMHFVSLALSFSLCLLFSPFYFEENIGVGKLDHTGRRAGVCVNISRGQ